MNIISNDIAHELLMLRSLTGIEFSHKLEQICQRKEFHPVKNEVGIDRNFVATFTKLYYK